MGTHVVFGELLAEARRAITSHDAMREFAPFPDDIASQAVTPHLPPCAGWLERETGLVSEAYPKLLATVRAAGPVAHWLETYADTDIGADFMERFGCYPIIGPNGPYASETYRLWMVFMPARLDYPWHHHPAEEIYFIVAGSAVFRKTGAEDIVLRSGDTSFHASSRSHAMETLDSPVLCLVAWRNEFETPPVLT